MNIAPSTTNIGTNNFAAVSAHSIAETLPKSGELAVDALFAPVEEVAKLASIPEYRQEPVVYEKPEQAAKEQTTNLKTLDEAEHDEQLLQQLKARDQEVRTHEQAHKAMGGVHAGVATYTYQVGPDGTRYAVGGEVSIDLSKEDDPQATIEKMQKIQRAALAPSEPSSQDRQMADQAGQKAAQAMNELAQEKQEQQQALEAARKAEQEKLEQQKEAAKKEQAKAESKIEHEEQVSQLNVKLNII